MASVSRRSFLRAGLLAGGSLTLGPSFYANAFASTPATPGPGPYGPLNAADALGIRLPDGFTARKIAQGGKRVLGTDYTWHVLNDGQATFPAADGGWYLVSNSESLVFTGAGCSAIRFAPDGTVVDAYRTLAGTNVNCAGGPTPWGTWLSGEEYELGGIWEVDPTGRTAARRRDAMGTFTHESACVDPVREEVYMTEDRPDGCFYRFTPSAYPDLSRGRLEAAVVAGDGAVSWVPVDPLPIPAPPKIQAQRKGATTFRGGEGTWWDGGIAYFTTKGDNRVWAYDCEQQRIEVLYDAAETGPEAPLRGVDNICVARSGDVYVCEDGDDLDLCLITPDREVARFCTFDPGVHRDTELVGVTFDPSGTRMYLGSQRSFTLGALYEITGPFRQPPPPVEPPSFGRDLPDGSVEDRLGSLAAVRVPTRISARELRGPGLPVRLALREPCVVKARLRGPLGAQVGYETFPTAVTGLTALRLKAPVTLTGRHELKVIVEPTGGGGVRETARSVTVT